MNSDSLNMVSRLGEGHMPCSFFLSEPQLKTTVKGICIADQKYLWFFEESFLFHWNWCTIGWYGMNLKTVFGSNNDVLKTIFCFTIFAMISIRTEGLDRHIVFRDVCTCSRTIVKGGFYSEGIDAFVISSNRRTLLFSWAWNFELFNGSNHITQGLEVALKAQKGSILLFEPSESHQALIWHNLSPLKYYKFKIQAQEINKVRLFEEMTNASVLSE